MLTLEEQQHKDEIVSLTAKALDDNGIECDTKISKYLKNNQWKYLNKLGELRNKRKNEEDKNTQEQLDIAV